MAHIFTVFCKAPGDKRGEYSEEIDIIISSRSLGRALSKAQAALTEGYAPGMKASRAVYRGQTSGPGIRLY